MAPRAEIREAASAAHGPLPEGAYPGTCLRLTAADQREPVRDVAAWATVTVARAALDVLRSARVRIERAGSEPPLASEIATNTLSLQSLVAP